MRCTKRKFDKQPLGSHSPPRGHIPGDLSDRTCRPMKVFGQPFPLILSAFARTDEDKTLGLAMLCGYAEHPPLGMQHLKRNGWRVYLGRGVFFDLDVFIQCYGCVLQTEALIIVGKYIWYCALFSVRFVCITSNQIANGRYSISMNLGWMAATSGDDTLQQVFETSTQMISIHFSHCTGTSCSYQWCGLWLFILKPKQLLEVTFGWSVESCW